MPGCGSVGVFFTHFSIVPALWPPDSAPAALWGVFFQHLAAFFDRSGGLGLFFTHFSIVPALCVPEDRAAKTHCRRLDCQLVFFKLKNALWGHFFEALILLDFQGLQVL